MITGTGSYGNLSGVVDHGVDNLITATGDGIHATSGNGSISVTTAAAVYEANTGNLTNPIFNKLNGGGLFNARGDGISAASSEAAR